MIKKEQCGIIHCQTGAANNKGGKTVIYTIVEDKLLVSIAYCNKTDSYNRKLGVQIALDRLNAHIQSPIPDMKTTPENVAYFKLPSLEKVLLMVVPQQLVLDIVNKAMQTTIEKNIKNTFKLATYGTALETIATNAANAAQITNIKDISKFCLEQLILSSLGEV